MNSYPFTHIEIKRRQNRLDGRDPDRQSLFLLYVAQLSGLRDIIDSAKEVLLQDQIWPDQCNLIAHQIKPFKKTAEAITQLLVNNKKVSSKTLNFSNYNAIVNSSHLSQQMEILIALFREFRELADQMRGKRSSRAQINYYLDSLESSLSDTLKELGKYVRGI
ncbi:MAG: hypothetical protein HYZ24_18035 [Chloroflexi bacterium]|nr:hypothetical protein [Chloroflexota bacterium]